MRSTVIPSVLIPPVPYSAISTERALKQIINLLERIEPDDERHYDEIAASIDDAKTMLDCICYKVLRSNR